MWVFEFCAKTTNKILKLDLSESKFSRTYLANDKAFITNNKFLQKKENNRNTFCKSLIIILWDLNPTLLYDYLICIKFLFAKIHY